MCRADCCRMPSRVLPLWHWSPSNTGVQQGSWWRPLGLSLLPVSTWGRSNKLGMSTILLPRWNCLQCVWIRSLDPNYVSSATKSVLQVGYVIPVCMIQYIGLCIRQNIYTSCREQQEEESWIKWKMNEEWTANGWYTKKDWIGSWRNEEIKYFMEGYKNTGSTNWRLYSCAWYLQFRNMITYSISWKTACLSLL